MQILKSEIKSAEILCVGTEILLGDIVNTNAAYLSRRLAELGIPVYHQSVVGDNPKRLAEELTAAFSRTDLVILTGGLGPTCDDLTKETVAEVFGKKLVMDDEALDFIKSYFKKIGRRMTENNEKQALVPEGCIVFHNDCGTAPGMAVEGGEGSPLSGRAAILLPGPPREMKAMFERSALPYLKSRTSSTLVSRNIHLFGIGESAAESLLRPMMDRADPTLAPYAKEGEVRLRVTARGKTTEEAIAKCDGMIDEVRGTEVGKFIYGIDVGSMENAVLEKLREKGQTFAAAESCTGGYIAKRVTDISGASDVFLGSAVTYACSAKVGIIGVSHDTLDKYGAVSEEVAKEMADGARRAFGADYAISTTGIAGPGGGTDETPVGTVYIAIASKEGVRAKRLSLSSQRDRDYIRTVASTNAFYLILEELQK